MRSKASSSPHDKSSLLRPDTKRRTLHKADLHLHTTHSDGQMTVPELPQRVVETDLSAIAITDHNTLSGAWEGQRLAQQHPYPFEIIVGEEVTTRDGDVVGLFLAEVPPPGLSAAESVRLIHRQGGLAFATHPFFRANTGQKLIGGIGHIVPALEFDALEVDSGTPLLEWANGRVARYAREHGLTALGNSDTHILEAVGKSLTLFWGKGAEDLRRALLSGAVHPGAGAHEPAELWAYLRFYLRYTAKDWQRRVAGEGLRGKLEGFCKSTQKQVQPIFRDRALEKRSAQKTLALQTKTGELKCP